MNLVKPENLKGITFFFMGAWLALSLLRYYNLYAGIFDLGIYDHLCWKVAALGDWQSTLTGHFRPVTIFYGLLYKLVPHPFVLLTMQWAAMVVGAFLLFIIGKRVIGRDDAWFFVSLYSLSILVQYQIFTDFHTDHLLVPIYLGIFYLITRDGPCADLWTKTGIVLLCIFSWMLKEPLILSVAFMGLCVGLWKRQYLFGIVIFVGSLVFFYLVTHVLWPYFRGQGVTLHAATGDYANLRGEFDYLGSNIKEALKTIFLSPETVLGALTSDWRKGLYVVVIFLPLMFLPLLSPILLLPILPPLFISLLSTSPNHYTPVYHYTAPMIGPLFVAGMFGFKRMVLRLGFAKQIRIAMAAGTLIVFLVYSPFPGTVLSFMLERHRIYLPEARTKVIRDLITEIIPSDEETVVCIQNNVFHHHLTHRKRFYIFPGNLEKADYVVIDTKREKFHYTVVDKRRYDEEVTRLLDKWEKIVDFDGFYIMRKPKPAPLSG